MLKLTSKNIAGPYLVIPFEFVDKNGKQLEHAFFIRIPESDEDSVYGVNVKKLVDKLREAGDSNASSS